MLALWRGVSGWEAAVADDGDDGVVGGVPVGSATAAGDGFLGGLAHGMNRTYAVRERRRRSALTSRSARRMAASR